MQKHIKLYNKNINKLNKSKILKKFFHHALVEMKDVFQ